MIKTIPLNEPCLTGDEWLVVKECFDTNWVSSAGPFIDKFGTKFANFIGSKYAIPLSSGTAAIHVALRVLGVQKKDHVLVPSLTFVASVNPITYVGAAPVFIGSDRSTFNMDSDEVVAKAKSMVDSGKKPKAIIVVHLYGHSVRLDPILSFCRKNNIYIIEDAAEALGTKYKGKFVGTIGDIGCFSFNGNKIITTGSGGMIATNNKRWAQKARYYSQQARDDGFDFIHNDIGYNYRMSNMQAALGTSQISHINEFLHKKKQIAMWYKRCLKNIKGITLNPQEDWCDNSYWLYSILVDEALFGMSARMLCKYLNKNNVLSRPFFKPIHTMPMYKHCDRTNMSDAMWLWRHGLNLPSSVGLKMDEVEKVASLILKAKNRS